jgi:hypothetical protein
MKILVNLVSRRKSLQEAVLSLAKTPSVDLGRMKGGLPVPMLVERWRLQGDKAAYMDAFRCHALDVPSSHRRRYRLVGLPSPWTPIVHDDFLKVIAPLGYMAWRGFLLVCLKNPWRVTRPVNPPFSGFRESDPLLDTGGTESRKARPHRATQSIALLPHTVGHAPSAYLSSVVASAHRVRAQSGTEFDTRPPPH